MIITPVISPCALGGGLQRDTRQSGNLRQMLLQLINYLERALSVLRRRPADAGPRSQGIRATFSFKRELYFIVQEPSGYMP